MKTIDASELIEHIDEVLRMVEEEGETIEITNHGEVIAHLVPVPEPQSSVESAKRDVWADSIVCLPKLEHIGLQMLVLSMRYVM